MYLTASKGLGQVLKSEPQQFQIKSNMPLIFFKYDSTELRHDAKDDSTIHLMSALSKIRKYVERTKKKGKRPVITLHGFASVDGERTHNIELSRKRAERIKELLVAADIDATIVTRGHGGDSTFPDRTFNRRVAFELQE